MNKTAQSAIIIVTAALAAQTALAQRPLGIDVSSSQGSINWSSVYANGVKFAYAKATEGTSFQDPDFKTNMKDGKAAGLLMGAYEFARPDIDTPSAEASYFWNFAGPNIKADGKSLMPTVDMEVFDGVVGASSYTAWVNDWASDVIADGNAAGVALAPILATTPCEACDFNSNLTLGLWLINYNGENYETGGPWGGASCNCHNEQWTFWGFGTGSIGGVSGSVDLDTYNGTFSELKSNEVVKAN